MDPITHPHLTHPLTGQPLVAVGFRKPRCGEFGPQPIWPIMGGAPDPDPEPDPQPDPEPDPQPDPEPDPDNNGFPENTPVKDMKPEEQAAYWRFHARKHETAFKSKFGADMTPEKLAALQQQVEEQRQQSLTDNERAIEQAREEGRKEAAGVANEKVLDTFIDARLNQLEKKRDDFPLLDTIDRSKLVTSDGDIDTDKVAKVLDAIIPLPSGDEGGKTWPFTGQGNRGNQSKSGKDAGKAEAARRFATND